MTPIQKANLRGAVAGLESVVQAIQASLDGDAASAPPPAGREADAVRRAQVMIEDRTRLSHHLPGDIFADPALDILLDLFIAAERDDRRTVKSVTIASRVPSTTALRWICVLEERGLIERLDDPTDGRVTIVRISGPARSGMRDWLTGCAQARPPLRRR